MSYAVNFFCSDPKHDNDDCAMGFDFDTREEAEACYLDPWSNETAARYCQASTAFVVLTSPEGMKKRRNPDQVASRHEDSDWRRESARQSGMAGGVEAYNDAMGY